MEGVSTIARSSLEEMLYSIRRRDEKLKDRPPALPTRPVSRGRLPSSRRSLPVNFEIGDSQVDCNRTVHKEVKKVDDEVKPLGDKEVKFRNGLLGSKRIKVENPEESPYASLSEVDSLKERLGEEDLEFVVRPSTSATKSSHKFGGNDPGGYVLKKKLPVWCWLPDSRWELGRIQSFSGEDANVSFPDSKVLTVSTGNLLPANPNFLDGVDDLIQLSYLNEPSVLHNLQHRYSQDIIYTKAGHVLVAINPFKEVDLYGNDYISAYRHKHMDGPHVYEIADNAFTEMMKDDASQSIIISGESGSGKTETAKVAMQYFAALGGGSGMEYEILQTNPILEAFGNARTLKNDNSSRFGKLIEIHFSVDGKICGAKIKTFLLEKSRVVHRAKGERSYHIFYQLCAGAPLRLREQLNLKTAKSYEYLKQSSCLIIGGSDDAQNFHALMEALNVVQISKIDQEHVFEMLAAVLWLGNISFSVCDNENHVEAAVDEAVISAAKLLGCNSEDIVVALSTHKIQAGKDNIVQKLTLSQAVDTRDALAKSIYASLFEWLVEQINMSLKVGKMFTERSISIVDIYGFESFHKNSFEQFCINYANERLQQHFIRHLFKLQLEEYAQDGIDWVKVEFVDNTECLNLFEKKPLGLLSLLDEESRFPRATDLTFANKLKNHLSANPCFKEDRGKAFRVSHYAGEVLYDTTGFLEKNRDPLHSDSIQLLLSSRNEFPRILASKILEKSKATSLRSSTGSDYQKQSVGTKFKGQLFKLMQMLENTRPHFIRCIKPNNKHLPCLYEHNLVLQQLRCCGVLEAVRIARSGYPTRMTHQQFARRYGFLLPESITPHDHLSVSVAVLQYFNVLPDMYQVGFTKLFFRTGQIAILEDARKRTLEGVIRVQKHFRGLHARRCFLQLKREMAALQSFIKGEIARGKFELLKRKWRAVVIIQTYAKRQIARKAFSSRRKSAACLQSVIRGWLARKHFSFLQDLEKLKPKQARDKNKLANGFAEEKGHNCDNKYPALDQSDLLRRLQIRVLKAEAALRKKEDENSRLFQKLQWYETRWSEYESKMKSMEETWQKQMTALQASLASARKSAVVDDTSHLQRRIDERFSPTPPYYDSEDVISSGAHNGEYTPNRTQWPHWLHDDGNCRVSGGGGHCTITHMVKEFEQRRQVFEDDIQFLSEVKSGQLIVNMNPDEELRKLKLRFSHWKRGYKVRLRETKMAFHKHGNPEVEKSRKKWWGKKMLKPL